MVYSFISDKTSRHGGRWIQESRPEIINSGRFRGCRILCCRDRFYYYGILQPDCAFLLNSAEITFYFLKYAFPRDAKSMSKGKIITLISCYENKFKIN